LLEALVLDYLSQATPEVKSLLDAAEADDLEAARPLLDAIESARQQLGDVWCEMVAFVEDYFQGNKARRRAVRKGLTTAQLYSASYRQVRPRIEKAIAEKEAELDALLDGFAGLSPRLKERANRRGEALQGEIDALRRDLCDRRRLGLLPGPVDRTQGRLGQGRQHAQRRGPASPEGRGPAVGGRGDRLSLPRPGQTA